MTIKPIIERNILRVVIIATLALMYYGLSKYQYYQIGKFTVFGASAILFYLEYRDKVLWYLPVSAIITALFNPFFKLEMGRDWWKQVDQELILVLAVVVIIDIASRIKIQLPRIKLRKESFYNPLNRRTNINK